MADTSINLEEGWVQHPNLTGGWHLEYVDPVAGFDISIVTGPPGSGLMGVIAPGKPTTYEAWLPGLSNPTGYLTLDELTWRHLRIFVRSTVMTLCIWTDPLKRVGRCKPSHSYYPQRRWVPHTRRTP
jgi:hypothetical protein